MAVNIDKRIVCQSIIGAEKIRATKTKDRKKKIKCLIKVMYV